MRVSVEEKRRRISGVVLPVLVYQRTGSPALTSLQHLARRSAAH